MHVYILEAHDAVACDVIVTRRSRGSIFAGKTASAWSPGPRLSGSQQPPGQYTPDGDLMQNAAGIDELKKVTHETIKYFIDPSVICITYTDIYRRFIPGSVGHTEEKAWLRDLGLCS